MIATPDRINISRVQKHLKGAKHGFDRALIGLGVSLKAPRKRTVKQTGVQSESASTTI